MGKRAQHSRNDRTAWTIAFAGFSVGLFGAAAGIVGTVSKMTPDKWAVFWALVVAASTCAAIAVVLFAGRLSEQGYTPNPVLVALLDDGTQLQLQLDRMTATNWTDSLFVRVMEWRKRVTDVLEPPKDATFEGISWMRDENLPFVPIGLSDTNYFMSFCGLDPTPDLRKCIEYLRYETEEGGSV